MGLRDEMLKKQETKLQEIQGQEVETQEQVQELLKLKSETARLTALVSTLNRENESLLSSKKQSDNLQSDNANLKKRLESVERERDNFAVKDKQAVESIGRLTKNVQDLNKEKTDLRSQLLDEKKKADGSHARSQEKFTSLQVLFVGNLLLNVILLYFLTREKKGIFQECGAWFTARANDLYHSLQWFRDGLYMGIYTAIKGKLHVGEVGGNLLTVLILVLIVGGLVALLRAYWWKIESILSNYRCYYTVQGEPYKMLKGIVSADIAIGLFIACLTFYEPFKKLMHGMNIFSIWLMLTAAVLIVWNGNDLIKGGR